MKLSEFFDEYLMRGPIKVYSSAGTLVAEIAEGDESGLYAARDYINGDVVKTVDMGAEGYAAYVMAKPMETANAVVMGYPGELADEAAFSRDWRSREAKASEKQLAFISKHYSLYMAVRKDRWPMNPKDLLRYEASDAMTEMLNIIRKEERRNRDGQ